MSELFDVVDEQDRVLRQETRAEVHRQRLLHRAVHVLVFNPGGEVYLQRRSAQKDTYPLRWTTSCSGHVDAGEDYDFAVVREMGEELGLKISGVSALTKLLKHGPCRETGWEFIWIYTHTTNAAPTPDPAEISEGRWSPPAELDAWMTREPKAFTPSFMLVWQLWRGKNVKD